MVLTISEVYCNRKTKVFCWERERLQGEDIFINEVKRTFYRTFYKMEDIFRSKRTMFKVGKMQTFWDKYNVGEKGGNNGCWQWICLHCFDLSAVIPSWWTFWTSDSVYELEHTGVFLTAADLDVNEWNSLLAFAPRAQIEPFSVVWPSSAQVIFKSTWMFLSHLKEIILRYHNGVNRKEVRSRRHHNLPVCLPSTDHHVCR